MFKHLHFLNSMETARPSNTWPPSKPEASNSFEVEPALLTVPTTDRVDVRFTPKTLVSEMFTLTHYYSHTIPIRIRQDMEMVWELYGFRYHPWTWDFTVVGL